MKYSNYKSIFLIFLASIAGCATKTNTPYSTMHSFGSARVVDCGGENLQWEACYQTASKDCSKGYKILEKRSSLSYGSPVQNAANNLVYEMQKGKDSRKFIRWMYYRCNK